jgi:signal transduction histidine kinase
MLSALMVAFVLLWGGAGRVARRLSRPFDELARVAEQLGEGHLDARVRLPFRAPLEIHVLGSALNDMAERIAQQLEDHRELLAGVSHELRTPLSRIRLLTELARAEPSAKTLDEIDREVVEMDALVDQLLVSSRLDFQQLSPKPLSAELLARRALERAGMAPTLLEVADPGEVEGDATLLGRALSNLIENAQRHGGGLTRLTVRREGQGVVSFAAEDEGPGFAEGDAERAFTAFFRGRGGENGTLGLGLSLVRRIAEAHGGTVFAMNRPDGGARVGFTLPARAP